MTSQRLPIGMLIVLWLVGWTLRVPILSAPPLATRIADTFGLNEAGVGAITMLPVIAIAFGAIPAALIIARFGLRIAIVGGLLVMVAASVARGYVPSTAMLFTVSVIMGLGVAVFQTALPAATRVWTPTHVVLGSAVYLNGMMFGELSGAGLTLPLILPIAGGDWRFALILWAIPIVLIAALVALMRLPNAKSDEAQTSWAAVRKALPQWNDGRVWQYGLLMAGSTVTFFVINAYAGTLLHARGESEYLESLLLAFNSMPLVASFIVLAAPNWIGMRGPIAISAVLSAAGLAGFTLLEGWASWGAALLVGVASTVELILLVSLPVKIASGIAVTRLSAGIILVGLSIAFVLPILGGWLADSMGSIELALVPSLIFSIALLPALGRAPQYPNYE
ncbi:MAG: MFS transporter [Rhodobacteraceae bacterium]|nr:MFS transporter [Paracoccaceae bacterium]